MQNILTGAFGESVADQAPHVRQFQAQRICQLETQVRRLQLELRSADERCWSVDFVNGAQQVTCAPHPTRERREAVHCSLLAAPRPSPCKA
jgi:hypothetical protein